ncbi:MAG: 16S rRNA (guanine(527)-N(7))-methyltransferase RsmG [Oscillospiraceae bacterium]|nr:16S rRNA (guanine(527)-N(7))-methyltransferase RsmG [Oscillospiraceae bacterium]
MKELLTAGIAALGIHVEDDCVETLERFAELLLAKNAVMNLTAITEPEKVATLHFLDSLTLLRAVDLTEKRVVDVGTGAGFPGMPLRIARRDFDLTLLDSLGKRVDFLRECCGELRLARTDCVHARAEEFAAQNRESFDVAVSRAVASLNVLSELCLPLVRVGGVFAAMKSVDSGDEIESARRAIELLGGKIARVEDHAIPCCDVSHRLVIIEKVRPTPVKYPRAFAKIKKQPL